MLYLPGIRQEFPDVPNNFLVFNKEILGKFPMHSLTNNYLTNNYLLELHPLELIAVIMIMFY